MLNTIKKKRSEKGFTIIEVMIVLAIAALILLIVFLAVPALQRNSRNTAIKNDAAGVAGGISTFESDNSGTTPTSISGTGGSVNITATGATTETTKVQGSTVVSTVTTVPTASFTTTGAIEAVIGKTCAGNSSSRAVSLYYNIEQTGGTSGVSLQCLDT